MFSPVALFEEGRRELAANQPRHFARLRELLPQAMAFYIHQPGHRGVWTAAAPWSRLEPGLLVLEDLAGPDRHHELKFQHISFPAVFEGFNSGSLIDEAGGEIAAFCPLVEAEDERLIRAWNEHSGLAPLPITVF